MEIIIDFIGKNLRISVFLITFVMLNHIKAVEGPQQLNR